MSTKSGEAQPLRWRSLIEQHGERSRKAVPGNRKPTDPIEYEYEHEYEYDRFLIMS